MSDNNKNITIKFELPQVVNKAIVPLAESVGNTISDLWKGTTIGIETWYNKKKLDQENYLKLYKENIQKELEKIPEDNIQEPSMNILGPALESSKYYFEKEWYRTMFSKLIAKSCDNRYNDKIHPFFVDAIKYMSPLDAKIISLFKNKDFLPIANYRYQIDKINGYNNCVSYVFYFDNKYCDPNKNASSITNLQHLGFISVNFNQRIIEDSAYEIYYRDPFFIEKRKQTTEKANNNVSYRDYNDLIIKKGVVHLTPLGKDFLNICME